MIKKIFPGNQREIYSHLKQKIIKISSDLKTMRGIIPHVRIISTFQLDLNSN